MKLLCLAILIAISGCALPVASEQTAESNGALHTSTITLQPAVTVRVNGAWAHSPSNQTLAQILGDYGAANPNASFVSAGPGPIGSEWVQFTAPSIFACNGIVSVQSVTAQYRLHTADANESFYFEIHQSADGGIQCGNLPPWRPVGFAFDCGSNTNPVTHANWTKQDIGCSGGSALVGGYEAGVHAGIVWEAMQIRATVTTL